MAFVLHRPGHQFPIVAATLIKPRHPVALGGTSGLLAVPVPSSNTKLFGFTGEATSLAGDAVTIYESCNVVKAVAGASLGAGAAVTMGSINGVQVPLTAASGTLQWQHGESLSPAAAGEVFSLYVNARQVGGNQ